MARVRLEWFGPALAAVLAGSGSIALAQAQGTSVEELQRQLQERDKVIAELLDRMEALERRVGVERPATAMREAPAPAPADPAPPREGAPGLVVVDEEAAERALERSLTQTGAVLLPSGILEVAPGVRYARQEDTAPRLITSGGDVLLGQTERNADSVTANVDFRLGLPLEAQLELGVPYRWRHVDTVTNVGFTPRDASGLSGDGLGDIRIGLAKTLLREGLWVPDLVGRVTWDSDTGEARADGVPLGGGFHEIRGSLTAVKRQDPIAFVGGLSYEHAFEKGDVQPGPTVSASFGGFIALSPETSLRMLVSGAYQGETQVSGRDIEGSDQALATFVVGGSTLLAPGVLLNLSTGIGLTDDADDFSVMMSLPIRLGSPLF